MLGEVVSAEAFCVVDSSPTSHIRTDNGAAWCGKVARGPVPTGEDAWRDSNGYHIGQHCIHCDTAYRKANGVYLVTFDF